MRPGRNLIVLGGVMIFLWFYSAFWPSTEARVIKAQLITFNQAGYSSGYRAPSYGGGAMVLSIAHYVYSVEGKEYYGRGVSQIEKLRSGGFSKIKVRYPSFYPNFSFSSRSSLLLSAILFILIGVGLAHIRLWVLKSLPKNTHNKHFK